MKIIKGTNKGFFANCSDVARHISQCIKNKERWYILWKDEMPYYDNNKGDNAWEYYFKQTHPFEDTTNIQSDCVDLHLIEPTFRETMSFIYNNFFILNEDTQAKIDAYLDFFSQNNVLGVHIRRTDKFLIGMYGTNAMQAPVDVSIFIKEIDEIKDNFNYIYLATDCIDTATQLHNRYGQKLIFNKNAFRGNGSNSIHNNFKEISGYKKGLDVLCDTYLLAKCKHIIRSSSNVSLVSLYINKNLTQLNVNEKYLNDNESCLLQ